MTKPSLSSSTPKVPKKRTTRPRKTAVDLVRPARAKKAVIEKDAAVDENIVTVVDSETAVVGTLPSESLPTYSTGSFSVNTTKQENRKLALWAAVSGMMFLIVFGWAWSLRYSLVVPSVQPPQELMKATNDLSSLFKSTVSQIKDIPVPSASPEVAPNNTASAEPLTPEELDVLKQKVIENTAPKSLPVQP
ncbi:MAG: hypothetical protein WC817_01470 [Patescibacteria group bacterium]|jgi:hypothetical protein